MEKIGNKIVNDKGVFFQLDHFNEGFLFKDEDAFLNHPDEVCYVPEYATDDATNLVALSDNCYTHNSLLELCDGNEEMCSDLFYELSWEFPETLLTEWEMNGTIDEFND